MQITYVLELLDPTSKKQNIFFKNIAEVVKNRQAIADLLKAGETKLSSADFKKHELRFSPPSLLDKSWSKA